MECSITSQEGPVNQPVMTNNIRISIVLKDGGNLEEILGLFIESKNKPEN